MKFTIALDVFNKAPTIEALLRSWLDNLSGKHEIELLITFDALRDQSAVIASQVIDEYPEVAARFMFTNDIFEIKCDNLMLQDATGDVVCFVQDDNSQYDPNWDATLADVMTSTPNIGAVGLLSGVRMHRNFDLDRMECYRPHKDERAWVHGINKDAYPLGVYQVDVINRPFAIGVDLLRSYGGLDESYCPMDYDDADLSFKLLRDGYTNLYVPFDLLNICAKKETLSQATIAENYMRGERIAKSRWSQFIAARESSVKFLYPMEASSEGLSVR